MRDGQVRDAAMYEDEDAAEADRKMHDDEGNEGVDVDPNALAYIRSRKAVHKLAAARKTQWIWFTTKKRENNWNRKHSQNLILL